MERLNDKVALITGAGSGIGRETAQLFAREGARVMVADLDAARAAATAEMIRTAGGAAESMQADVTHAAGCEAIVRKTVERFGQLHILHNNVGLYGRGSLLDMDEDTFDRVVLVNLKTVFLMSRAAVPELQKAAGKAVIINVGSALAFLGVGSSIAYTAAKGGVISMTRKLAVELAPRGIRVNCYCPTTVDTPMVAPGFAGEQGQARLEAHIREIPLGRIGVPRDVANLAVFLASDESAWMTGSVIMLDGGQSIV